MGYPYDKRYIDKIRDNSDECRQIREAFYLLQEKYTKDNNIPSDIDLSLQEQFRLLGEAFELASVTLDGAVDVYHFMWDVLEELLEPKRGDNEL